MADAVKRMSVATREDFLEFLEQLSRVSTTSISAREKKAKLGKNRFSKPGKCHLLDLPPELRNCIYRTIYPLHHSESHISPFDIHNPDPNFLHTCSQIYTEARGYYEQARGHLWMDSNFLIRKSAIKPANLQILDKIDLDLISRVTIINDEYGGGKLMLATLIDFRGGWQIQYIDDSSRNNASLQIVKTEYVCIHQRLAGVWKGMTWVEFHGTREKMDESLNRIGIHAGMKDQIMQILLVGPEEVKRIAVRTFWRNVAGQAQQQQVLP